MRKDGYDEETIALATGSSQSVSEDVLEARKVFNELYNKFKIERDEATRNQPGSPNIVETLHKK